MNAIMCTEHHNGQTVVDARARVHASNGLAIGTSWTFATKPYGQRPSGAPPG